MRAGLTLEPAKPVRFSSEIPVLGKTGRISEIVQIEIG
jgi:hypothetical protein